MTMTIYDGIKREEGFSFIEVVVAIFILSLTAGPLISLLTVSWQACLTAWQHTQATYLAQGILETILDQSAAAAGTGEFVTHPDWPQYEYRVTVEPHVDILLHRVTVELRKAGQSEDVISFTTLEVRRKGYERIPY